MSGRLAALVALVMIGAPSFGWARSPANVSADDRQQILDLVAKYSYTYDARGLESFLVLFVKTDAEWKFASRSAFIDQAEAGK